MSITLAFIEQLERQVWGLAKTHADNTIEIIDTRSEIDKLIHPEQEGEDPRWGTMEDFAEGAFQALQMVRIESGFDTIDYHDCYPPPFLTNNN